MLPPVDHLVFAAPDLEEGVAEVERLLGIRPGPGGRHDGLGTHNALLSLGRGTYLEVIAPDPSQPAPARPRPFGLDSLREPRLVAWAVAVHGIEDRVARAKTAGYDPGALVPMSRSSGDERLTWRLTHRERLSGDGVVPFLIEWDPGPHPSRNAPAGCFLLDLEGEHPHPETVTPALDALGIDLQVAEAGRAALVATIECPRGTVILS